MCHILVTFISDTWKTQSHFGHIYGHIWVTFTVIFWSHLQSHLVTFTVTFWYVNGSCHTRTRHGKSERVTSRTLIKYKPCFGCHILVTFTYDTFNTWSHSGHIWVTITVTFGSHLQSHFGHIYGHILVTFTITCWSHLHVTHEYTAHKMWHTQDMWHIKCAMCHRPLMCHIFTRKCDTSKTRLIKCDTPKACGTYNAPCFGCVTLNLTKVWHIEITAHKMWHTQGMRHIKCFFFSHFMCHIPLICHIFWVVYSQIYELVLRVTCLWCVTFYDLCFGCVTYTYIEWSFSADEPYNYEVATMSRLLKIIGLFCKRTL